MGKRSREKRLNRAVPPPAGNSAETVPQASARPKLAGGRLLAMRLLLVIVVPGIILLLLEAALRITGFGYSPRFLEKTSDGSALTTNPQFAWQFYSRDTATTPTPLIVNPVKAPGTRRILILGESAAAGTPDPAFGFARQLELMLRREHPGNRFEVVNAAMRGINSHIILPIARECAQLSPDLVIVYIGNNEVIGLHSPTPGEFSFNRSLRLLRLGQWIKSTRLAQLTQSMLGKVLPKSPKPLQDMAYLRTQRLAFDDPQRDPVYDHFRRNLEDICDAVQSSGAQVILASVGSNLRDFPPLASLHRPGLTTAQTTELEKSYAAGIAAEARTNRAEALVRFHAAVAIDDHFAELHFRLARASEAAGQPDAARQHYALARDWDALQFRADSRLNAVVRQVATSRNPQATRFLDVEKSLAECPLAEAGVAGRKIFHEHVHFTFDGDHQLARIFLPAVAETLRLGAATGPAITRDDCARALAYTSLDEANVLAAMAQQTGKPPFLDQLDHATRQAEMERLVKDRLTRFAVQDYEQAAGIYRAAIAASPDDWMLRYNYANLLGGRGKFAEALPEFQFVIGRLPRQRMFRMNYGSVLLQAGRASEAAAQFRAALTVDPDFAPARDALAAAQRRRR